MNPSTQHNVGAYVAVATSVAPQAASAAVNGSSISRLAHNLALSCVLHLMAGAEAGSPTGASVVAKLQHSPDGATWADYTPPGAASVAQTAALTAVNTETSLAIDLSSANTYVRAVVTPTLTGGTSPTILLAADLVFGGESLGPAV
jgi:hypothetical protein